MKFGVNIRVNKTKKEYSLVFTTGVDQHKITFLDRKSVV